MKKRRYPLFIIDTSRAHGRELETDYISCTSIELPFVAEITYITETQYHREYDRENQLTKYSDETNGFRLKIEVVQVREDYDSTALRSLLNKALGELIKRRNLCLASSLPVSEVNKIIFLDEMIKQGRQQLRNDPKNDVIRKSLGILSSLRADYNYELCEESLPK